LTALPEVWHFKVSASALIAGPRTQAEINKMPKKTKIDFFVTIIVSSFVVLKV
jgi:hypothetical protein